MREDPLHTEALLSRTSALLRGPGMAAPRLDADGSLQAGLEKTHTGEDADFLRAIGYRTVPYRGAYLSAVALTPPPAPLEA
jgi:hypothetical protein